MLFGAEKNNNNDNSLLKYIWENLSKITLSLAHLTIFVGYETNYKTLLLLT